ncbi:heparan-alpha-glucosaminide N-acetyltransferase [Devosia sp. ZB163]|uniref:DUF1624 domain-containing protein n=1 Tax=Devosia sp. ZB163 TaxID=3025938 RepID=UPI002362B474|nr:heparan-alpha-glucosaminide N-acetyltransferase [Devosia sp. ZB163]MDC9822793.1 heparan-alpha-glucosaminide N-acetyltransferase [Devosia sp. ZB163]
MTIDVAGAGQRPRYQLLDILRGVAILAMIVFHVAWDLYYFGYSSVDPTSDLGWVIFQKSILSSFLLLVGAGLYLAHGRGIRWRKFWRRFALIVAGAVLVTAGTYWMFPDFFVFFGVLHAIALFSLMGLAFLRLPPLLVAAIGAAVIAANFLWSDPAFSSRELGWIGFWTSSPPTSDVVPIFPWFGVVLLGIAGMRLLLASPLEPRLAAFSSNEPLARGLAFAGRWSLLIYLVHQPVIIAVLWGVSQVQPAVVSPPVASVSESFLQSCNQSCEATGSAPGRCERYCQCAIEQVEKDGMWDIVIATDPTAEQLARMNQVANLCTAMVDTPPGP